MWEKMAVGTQLLLSRNSLPVTPAPYRAAAGQPRLFSQSFGQDG